MDSDQGGRTRALDLGNGTDSAMVAGKRRCAPGRAIPVVASRLTGLNPPGDSLSVRRGARMLVEGASALGVVPKSGWPAVLIVTVDYLLVVPSLLFWAELGIGNFRRLSQAGALVGAAIGIAGLGVFSTTGSPHTLLAYNHLLAIFMLLVVGIVAAVPRLSRKFLVIQSRVLGICMPVIAGVALWVNLAGLLGFDLRPISSPLPSHSSSFRCICRRTKDLCQRTPPAVD